MRKILLLIIIASLVLLGCQSQQKAANKEPLTSTIPSQTGCEAQFDAEECATDDCVNKKNCWPFCEDFCQQNKMTIKSSLRSLVNGKSYCNCICNSC